MFNRGRRKRRRKGTAQTFVDATGGGWGEAPDVIAVNGGSQADFVEQTLLRARDYALQNGVEVGQTFTYTITDIPRGISGPHEIIMGLMMRSHAYGLTVCVAFNEDLELTRLR